MSTRGGLVLIAVAGVLAHATSLGGGFVFDDKQAVLESPVVRAPFDATAMLTRDFWGRPAGPRSAGTWRPLPVLTLWIDWRTGGGAPRAFHVTSLVAHIAASLALALALAVQTRRPRLAVVAALLFAALAACSEAVASIVGRADVMATGFLLLAWAAAGHPSEGGVGRATASAACLLAAMLCKESAVVFPLLLLASDRILAEPGKAPRLVSFRYLLPLGAVLLAVALRLHFFGNPRLLLRTDNNNPLLDASLGARLLTAPRLFLMALRLLLVPLNLSADYSFAEIVPDRAPSVEGIAGAAALLLLCAGVIRRRHSDPMLALGAALLIVGWLPSSQVAFALPTIFAERLLYLPAAGAAVLMARVVEAVAECWNHRRAAALLAALLVGNGVRAAFADRAWHDDLTLFAQATAVSTRSARAWLNYGTALDRAGRTEDAMRAVERGLDIAPAWSALHAEAGVLLDKAGRPDAAGAALRRAAALDPGDPRAAYNLALLLARQGDRTTALQVATRFLAEYPDRATEDAPLARLAADLRR